MAVVLKVKPGWVRRPICTRSQSGVVSAWSAHCRRRPRPFFWAGDSRAALDQVVAAADRLRRARVVESSRMALEAAATSSRC